MASPEASSWIASLPLVARNDGHQSRFFAWRRQFTRARESMMNQRRLIQSSGALVLSAGLLAACAGPPNPCGPTAIAAAVTGDVAGYQLGPGDELQVTVFDQPDLSGKFRLDGQGSLALPLVGEVAAKRLTTRELEQAIADRLREGDYILHPQVSIEVLTYRPFYILGEVSKPGQYEYQNGMTVINAVALAGGYTYRARESKVTIERGGCSFVAKPDTAVLPGEVITVPERYI
jgi:polysaccharide export outer membrane protein